MAEWQGKSKGTPFGYRVFIAILRNFGVKPAYAFLYIIASYYFLFSWQSSRWSYYFFHKRMGYSKLKSILKIYESYLMLGQTLIDRVVVSAGIGGKITSESFGAENLHNMVALKKGGILLGSHIGNWGIASQYLMNYDKNINVLVYDIEHEQIKKTLEETTGGRGYNMILIKDDLSHIFEIGEALQRGEIICMTADRFMPGARTASVKFIGEYAQFGVGPFQIIKSFRAPYSFVYGVKAGGTHYHCFARPHREVTRESTTEQIMQDYVQDLEGIVMKYPEQWFNYYDFWKKA
jgi:predicted LPLAT superfamily acyltransferase